MFPSFLVSFLSYNFRLKVVFLGNITPSVQSEINFCKNDVKVECEKLLKENSIAGRTWNCAKLFVLKNGTAIVMCLSNINL